MGGVARLLGTEFGPGTGRLARRRYADKYRHPGEAIHLVAVEFSKDARTLSNR